MTSSRRTITTVTLLALAVLGLIPAAAGAGSLLSGYGAPGEGNQAILGSALLNGHSGKGGSGGASNGGSSGSSGSLAGASIAARSQLPVASGGAEAGTAKPRNGASAGARRHASPAGARGKHATRASREASAGGARAYRRVPGSTASRAPSGASQPLGLSGADLVYILLALGMLLLTGALTKRLARANAHEDAASTQAKRRRTRLTN